MRRRFEKMLFVGLPDETSRLQMIERGLKDIQHTLTSDQKKELAIKSTGFSGSG